MVMGLAGSHTSGIADELNLAHISEAFADRRYTADGKLVSRKIPGAVITDPDEAAAQVLNIVKYGFVVAEDGSKVTMQAQSICIHGDTSSAVEIAKAVTSLLRTNSIEIGSE